MSAATHAPPSRLAGGTWRRFDLLVAKGEEGEPRTQDKPREERQTLVSICAPTRPTLFRRGEMELGGARGRQGVCDDAMRQRGGGWGRHGIWDLGNHRRCRGDAERPNIIRDVAGGSAARGHRYSPWGWREGNGDEHVWEGAKEAERGGSASQWPKLHCEALQPSTKIHHDSCVV